MIKAYIFKNKLNTLVYLIVSVAFGFMGVFTTLCTQQISKIVFGEIDANTYQLLIVPVVYLAVTCTMVFLYNFVKNRFLNKVMYNIRQDLFQSITAKNMTSYYEKNTSYYLSIFNNDLQVVEQCISFAFIFFLQVGEIIFSLTYAFTQNTFIGVSLIIIGLISAFLPVVTRKLLKKLNESYMSELAVHNTVLNSCFSGFEVIKNYQMEQNIIKNYGKENDVIMQKKIHLDNTKANVSMQGYRLMEGLQFLVLAVVGILIMGDKLNATLLVVMGTLFNSVSGSMYGALNAIVEIKAGKGICDKIFGEIKDSGTEENEKQVELKQDITFENVRFTYPGSEKEILKGVDLTFEKNKKYAIVGESGSGKSTITRLLLRYYDNYEGSISLDGTECGEISERSLMENFAVIPQSVYVFEDTFRNNITLYRDFTDAQIMTAIQKAGLMNVYERLEKGLDTMLKENGANLSGGERQRMSIARAFLYQRKIFILDEATASLDNRLAYQIEKTIVDTQDITVIMVTHHYNEENLRKCDGIFVIGQGKVEETGTFEELMDRHGTYYRMYQLQNGEGCQ